MKDRKLFFVVILAVLCFGAGDDKPKSKPIFDFTKYKYAKPAKKQRLLAQFGRDVGLKDKKAFFAKIGAEPIVFGVFGFDIAEWKNGSPTNVSAALKDKKKFITAAAKLLGVKIIDYSVEELEKRLVPQGSCAFPLHNYYRDNEIVPWYDEMVRVNAAHRFIARQRIKLEPHGVVVVDSEPATYHRDLRAVVRYDKNGKMIYWKKDKSKTEYGEHGTHVSCIVAAARDSYGVEGVAPKGTYLLPLVVNYLNGSFYFYSDIAIGLKYFIDLEKTGQIKFRVVNMSWGWWSESEILKSAIKNSPDKLFVVAAGNEGLNLDIDADKIYPAAWKFPNIITVAASDANDHLAQFSKKGSNYGPETVGIAAPGVDILSCLPDNNYENWQGTSMAAPIVSGIATALFSISPKLSVNQAKHIIYFSAVSKERLLNKVVGGKRVDMLAAEKLLWKMMNGL